jgi:N-methylhydantoinase A
MEVRVPAPSGAVDASFIAGTIDAFHAAHRKAFGYNYAGRQKVEIVNFCVSGFGMIERPIIAKLAIAADAKPRCGTRPAYFSGAFRDTPIYERASLPVGFRLDGPAIIEEFGSTTVVFPGQWLEVDEHGILVVRRETSR